MADKDYKAFIVEGEAREPQVIDNISKVFFKHGNLKIITLPAGENIYMLWKKLKADDGDVINQMLESFDNETENGKLYISYPMVEALRDFEAGKCGNEDNCFVEISDLAEYKNISSRNSLNPHFRDYNIDVWKEIVDVFSMRISCLLGNAEVISYEQYLDEANPHDIFMCEQALAGNNKVFIISAFPEFLVDYFGMKFWRTCVKHAKNQLDICNC